MTKKKKLDSDQILIEAILKGIEDKKGFDIKILDLSGLPNAVTSKFIICSGNSTTQIDAIADSILEDCWKLAKERPYHFEGKENKEWILLDFVTIVVHIFIPEVREFYGLEELWADAKVELIEFENL